MTALQVGEESVTGNSELFVWWLRIIEKCQYARTRLARIESSILTVT